MATTPTHAAATYGPGWQSTPGATSGPPAGGPDEPRSIRPRKDYGRGLPPPGPSNRLYSTPSILTFFDREDSEQGE